MVWRRSDTVVLERQAVRTIDLAGGVATGVVAGVGHQSAFFGMIFGKKETPQVVIERTSSG